MVSNCHLARIGLRSSVSGAAVVLALGTPAAADAQALAESVMVGQSNKPDAQTPVTVAPKSSTPQASDAGPDAPPVAIDDKANQAKNTQDADVVVRGFRSAYDDALRTKRVRVEFSDTVSAEGLDRFPDLNVGEALTRIPGIQINREDSSRNASVNVRGLPSSFAKVTLNGASFAAPTDPINGGGVFLGAFSSDLFTAFTVIKSPLAEQPAGGLAGNIDLRIGPALSRRQGGSIRFYQEYNALGQTVAPGVTASYNKKLADNFAVFGVIAYREENFRRDSLQSSYLPLTLGAAPLFDPASIVSSTGDRANDPATGRLAGVQANPFSAAQFAGFFARAVALNPAQPNILTCPVAAPGEPPNVCLTYRPALGTGAGAFTNAILNGPTADPRVLNLGTGQQSTKGLYYPNNVRFNVRQTVGSLLSGTAGAEWQITPELRANVIGFFTQRTLDQSTLENYSVSNGNGNQNVIQLDASTIFQVGDGRAYVDRYSAINTVINTSNRLETGESNAYGINGSLEWKNKDWRITSSYTASTSRSLSTQLFISRLSNPVNVTRANPLGNGVRSTIDLGGGRVQDFSYSVTPAAPVRLLSGPLRNVNPANPEDIQQVNGTNERMQLLGFFATADVRADFISQEFERFVKWGPISSIQLGYVRDRYRYNSVFFSNGAAGFANANNVISAEDAARFQDPAILQTSRYANDFFGGQVVFPGPNWQTTNFQYALDSLRPNPANLLAVDPVTNSGPQELTPMGFVNNRANALFALNNFNYVSTVDAVYFESKLNSSIFGIGIRGNIGLRYERTQVAISALERVSTVDRVVLPPVPPSTTPTTTTRNVLTFPTREYRDNYGYFLPSFLFAFDLTDKLLFRVGGYRTYVRPQVKENNPVSAATRTETDSATNFNVTLGANNIEPFTADSLDIGLEWYNRRGSVVAANFYIKRISGFIRPTTDPNILCPASGIFAGGADFGTGPLTRDTSNRCVGTEGDPNNLTANGVPAPLFVNVTAVENNPQTITVRGYEFNIQQNLDFLPGILKYFGTNIIYSVTDIDGADEQGIPFVLPGVSRDNLGVAAYYETPAFGARVIYNLRNPYLLQPNGTFQPGSRTAARRAQVDFSVSVNVSRRFTISLDGYNLTDALREEYEAPDAPRTLRRSDFDGRTFTISARGRF